MSEARTAVTARDNSEGTRQGGAVAVIKPSRLPYHPTIEERFGVDRAAWRALTDAVFPSAQTTDAIILALSYCKARKLDPFKRVVHIVPVWDSEKGGMVETVWPGIAEHRTTAFRTKQYAGSEAAQFGDLVTKEFTGQTKKGAVKATVQFPSWCQLTVYRMIDGQRVPVPGPRVYWLETYSRMGRTDVPNDRWQRAPFQMIEKCAEAAALRRAFPEELGDESTMEEIGSRYHGGETQEIEATTPARPTRAEYLATAQDPAYDAAVEEGAYTGDIVTEIANESGHDPETGEIIEAEAQPVAETKPAAKRQTPATEATPSTPPEGWIAWNSRMSLDLDACDNQTEFQRLEWLFETFIKGFEEGSPKKAQSLRELVAITKERVMKAAAEKAA